jgi:hypothetical protein
MRRILPVQIVRKGASACHFIPTEPVYHVQKGTTSIEGVPHVEWIGRPRDGEYWAICNAENETKKASHFLCVNQTRVSPAGEGV